MSGSDEGSEEKWTDRGPGREGRGLLWCEECRGKPPAGVEERAAVRREQQCTGPWCVSAAQLRTSKKTKGATVVGGEPRGGRAGRGGLAAFTLRKMGDHCRAMTRGALEDRRVASVFYFENCQIHREVAITI